MVGTLIAPIREQLERERERAESAERELEGLRGRSRQSAHRSRRAPISARTSSPETAAHELAAAAARVGPYGSLGAGEYVSPTSTACRCGASSITTTRSTGRGTADPDRDALAARCRVLWRDKTGVYRREADEESAFIEIGERVYRDRRAELRPG